MIISKTPFRISFFGGGTDYPEWYREHGGMVVGTTINKYCYITCRRYPQFSEVKSRIIYSQIEEVLDNLKIKHTAIKECLRYCGIDFGIELFYIADMPAKSGIGSSSTFIAGLLKTLSAFKYRSYSPSALVDDVTFIERDVLQETVGHQDQIWAAHGGFNKINFHPTGNICIEPLAIAEHDRKDLERSIMLVYSPRKTTSSSIASTYAKDNSAHEKQYKELMQIAKEGVVHLEQGNIRKVGELLSENWKQKRASSPNIATREIDDIYQAAMDNGAWGGKLIGAGGGGFMMLIVPPVEQPKVRRALAGLPIFDVKFEPFGSHIIHFDE